MTLTRSAIQQEFLDSAVLRAQVEILSDISNGTVPKDVQDFAALHDYVDANCYAGCCDESSATDLQGMDLWNSIFPANPADDHEVLGSVATLDAMNEMQSRLDQWLLSRALSSI